MSIDLLLTYLDHNLIRLKLAHRNMEKIMYLIESKFFIFVWCYFLWSIKALRISLLKIKYLKLPKLGISRTLRLCFLFLWHASQHKILKCSALIYLVAVVNTVVILPVLNIVIRCSNCNNSTHLSVKFQLFWFLCKPLYKQ